MSKNLKNDRLFLESKNTQGCLMKIIEYYNDKNIIVEFQDEYKSQRKTSYRYFKRGEVINFYFPNVCGIGIIGDTRTSSGGKMKNSYNIWNSMINRCYNNRVKEKHNTYTNCYVCNEWLCYANFEKWYDENYYEVCEINNKMCLDKDILVKGNKIYSPETCVFVPNNINCLFTKTDKLREIFPIGVYLSKDGSYVSQMSITKNGTKTKKYLGRYSSINSAFLEYKKNKEKHIKNVADYYSDKIPNKIYEAMYNYTVEQTD